MMPLGLVIIEVCSRNAIQSEALEKFILNQPEITLMRMECLNNCTLCTVQPFVQVNGKLVTARSAEKCMTRAKEEVTKELQFYTGDTSSYSPPT